ncbi:hypothetical protein [Methylobacterium soli]|jgi:hypothetical protein|uniref:Uncharacterized protein n=1 Tax=Methylobacterium soli TaxID=553447 RepID=A0A6L3SNL4_9HYPH|nr:hypothetical protein [Methylobacterium soli]KAB1069350.1 hypothetical protein F6X53_31005 [Methylobacterium soli]GJE42990.1 hypothetical protein AEGHOMDF_2167 [Methylobacterium soli]
MRRPALALLLGLATAMPASGQNRSATPRQTCMDVMNLVKREGAVVLSTGGNAAERIVRDRSFCEFTEIAELRFAPTRDNPQCPIGYRCKEPGYEDWDWDWK